MEQTNMETTPTQRPGFLTTLCILSYIGSGFWALISLIGIFASGFIMSFFQSGAMNEMDTSGLSEEQLQAMEMMQSGGGMMEMISSYIVVIFILSLIMAALSLLGVAKMWKQKKSGFIMYTIVNGLMVILGLIGGGIFGAVVGIAFIVMYGLNLKHMS